MPPAVIENPILTSPDLEPTRHFRFDEADIDETARESLCSATSRSFSRPASGKIAVKVINRYGDEILQVYGRTAWGES